MTLRARLANWLHSLAYRIEPQTWYAGVDVSSAAGLANVEFVRDLGAGTFDVKPRTPIQRRRTPAKPQPPVPKPGKGG